MVNEVPTLKKKIIFKYFKPLLTFTKKEDPYELRVKSAPPLNIIEERKEPKKFVLCKPDGTPITLDDLSDISDSEEEEDTKLDMKDSIKEDVKDSIKEDVKDSSKEDVKDDVIEDVKGSINEEINSTCGTCSFINLKREKILNELLEMYRVEESVPYSFVPTNVPQIMYSVGEILNCINKIPFTLKLLKKDVNKIPVNYKEFKINKETIIEKATFELNKLTNTNIKRIITNLKNLNIETIQQAKYLGNLIVFKAINEPQYCNLYAMVVGALKKDFKSKEELGLHKKQTAFFGTVLTSAMKVLEEKVEWADTKVLDKNLYKNAFEYERAFEEQETERYLRKKKTLGAVNLLCDLYNLDVITLKHIQSRLNEFLNIENEEVVEVLGKFIEKIGEKMYLNDKSDYANMICSYLDACKNKYSNRVKFYIMDVLDKKKNWKKPVSKTENLFSSLIMEDEPALDTPYQYQEQVIANEEEEDSLELLKTIDNIYQDLKDAYDEEDEIMIADNFKIASNTFGKISFFSTYFSECITNSRKSKLLVPFVINFFNETNLNESELFDIINKHKEKLNELKIDFPLSQKNYVTLCDQLCSGQIIKEDTYDKLII